MMSRLVAAVLALTALVTVGCAGPGDRALTANSPRPSAFAAANGAQRPPGAAVTELIGEGLVHPAALAFFDNKILVGDDGSCKAFSRAAGTSQELAIDASLFEGASSRVVNRIATVPSAVVIGFGDAVEGRIMALPLDGSRPSLLVRGPGIRFLGTIGNNILYLKNSSLMTLTYGTRIRQTLARQVFPSAGITDGRSLFYQDSLSHDVIAMSFDGTGPLRLIVDNSVDGELFQDKAYVYQGVGGDVKQVSKSSGAVSTLYAGDARILALNETDVFIVEHDVIKAVSKATSSVRVIGDGAGVTVGIAGHDYLYYVVEKSGSANLYRTRLTS